MTSRNGNGLKPLKIIPKRVLTAGSTHRPTRINRLLNSIPDIVFGYDKRLFDDGIGDCFGIWIEFKAKHNRPNQWNRGFDHARACIRGFIDCAVLAPRCFLDAGEDFSGDIFEGSGF